MNDDPFSPVSSKVNEEVQSTSYSSNFLGYFICSFDTTYGLQILYSFPSALRKNSEEINLLKTHYIWKIKLIPIRIDFKFSEFVYSAFQLHESTNPEVLATAEKPLFGVVVKLWKDEDPIPSEILLELKNNLQDNYWEEIKLLHKFHVLATNPVRRREYKQLSPQIGEIKRKMQVLWESFLNQIPNVRVKVQHKEDQVLERSIHLSKRGFDRQDLFRDSITVRIATPSDSIDEVLVILTNQTGILHDVTILVAHISEFFSENLWEHSVDVWPKKEEIILEFSRTINVEKYQIKIISEDRTVSIKTVEIDFLR